MTENDLKLHLSNSIRETTNISKQLFADMGVKRGLRNEDNTGVLVGLTRIADVIGYEKQSDGTIENIPGKLIYRGLDVEELVNNIMEDNRLGFEETAFLLMSGSLPNEEELKLFTDLLIKTMPLDHITTMNILSLKGSNIMNILARSVLELYVHDDNPDEVSRDNLIKQSINLIAKFPTIIAYAYQVLRHNRMNRSMHIRHPLGNKSVAENFLYMMKGYDNYTELDVKTLDLSLILHAEHGGGNNSSFSVRVVSSTETDTYSAIAAGIGSLKGALHGGANIGVRKMLDSFKENIEDWEDLQAIDDYIERILRKEAHDKSGLIYGIGHAVYTLSDPRTTLLKKMAKELAIEKGLENEFNFMSLIEERAIKKFMEFKGPGAKQVCANVDFYSGFVYGMLGLPEEVYTPLFAMARIVGWSAHRIEELNFTSKRIIRPAYKNVRERKEFTALKDR